MTNAVRWTLNWLAPILLVLAGTAGLISMTGVFDCEREMGSLVIRDPWWVTVAVCSVLIVLGALGLRLSLRRRRHAQ